MKRNELVYFLTGAGVGAVVGILLAPSAGRDMRNALTNRTQEGLDRISQKVDDGKRYVQDSKLGKQAGEAVRNVVERSKNVTQSARQRLNDSVEAGKAKYGESIESTREEGDVSSF